MERGWHERNDFIIIDEYEYSMKMISFNSKPGVQVLFAISMVCARKRMLLCFDIDMRSEIE